MGIVNSVCIQCDRGYLEEDDDDDNSPNSIKFSLPFPQNMDRSKDDKVEENQASCSYDDTKNENIYVETIVDKDNLENFAHLNNSDSMEYQEIIEDENNPDLEFDFVRC